MFCCLQRWFSLFCFCYFVQWEVSCVIGALFGFGWLAGWCFLGGCACIFCFGVCFLFVGLVFCCLVFVGFFNGAIWIRYYATRCYTSRLNIWQVCIVLRKCITHFQKTTANPQNKPALQPNPGKYKNAVDTTGKITKFTYHPLEKHIQFFFKAKTLHRSCFTVYKALRDLIESSDLTNVAVYCKFLSTWKVLVNDSGIRARDYYHRGKLPLLLKLHSVSYLN